MKRFNFFVGIFSFFFLSLYVASSFGGKATGRNGCSKYLNSSNGIANYYTHNLIIEREKIRKSCLNRKRMVSVAILESFKKNFFVPYRNWRAMVHPILNYKPVRQPKKEVEFSLADEISIDTFRSKAQGDPDFLSEEMLIRVKVFGNNPFS